MGTYRSQLIHHETDFELERRYRWTPPGEAWATLFSDDPQPITAWERSLAEPAERPAPA